MKKANTGKIITLLAAAFVVIAVIFMFPSFIDFSKKRKSDSTIMPEATGTTERIENGIVVEQTFTNTTDTITQVGIVFVRIQYLEGTDMVLELYDGNALLARSSYPIHLIEDEHRTYIVPSNSLSGMKNKNLTIKIYSKDKEDTGFAVLVSENEDAEYRFGNTSIKGSLCFSVTE